MFRLKIVLVFILVVVLGTIGVLQLVGASEADLQARVLADVEKSYMAFERSKRLRDLQLKDLAAAFAKSDVGAYLAALQDNRKRMLEVEGDVYRAVPGDPNDDALKEVRSKYLKEKHAAFLDTVSADLAARLERVRGANAWQAKPKAEAIKEIRETLTVCNSFGVNNCAFRLSYFPLKEVADAMRKSNPYGITPDLVIITDHKGTGLADVDRPKWSDQQAFGSEHPIVTEVKRGAILRDIVKLKDDYYFATAAPIFESGRFRGAVLVGVEISSELTNEESEMFGRMVGYIDSKELIRSNLSPQAATELRHNLPPRVDPPRIQTLSTPTLAAQFVPITGNLTNNHIRAVLIVDRNVATATLGNMRTWLILGAVVLIIIGLLALAWILHGFMKPFVALDAGIHEVANGNTDYTFPVDAKEQLWSSMGHSLNLMVGTLTGRDLDEDSYHGDWDDDMLAADERKPKIV